MFIFVIAFFVIIYFLLIYFILFLYLCTFSATLNNRCFFFLSQTRQFFINDYFVEVYTDMLKTSHHTWVWYHDYSPVARSVLNYKFSSHGPYACATVSYHYNRFHRTFSYDVKPVDCTDEHYPLCMRKLS